MNTHRDRPRMVGPPAEADTAPRRAIERALATSRLEQCKAPRRPNRPWPPEADASRCEMIWVGSRFRIAACQLPSDELVCPADVLFVLPFEVPAIGSLLVTASTYCRRLTGLLHSNCIKWTLAFIRPSSWSERVCCFAQIGFNRCSNLRAPMVWHQRHPRLMPSAAYSSTRSCSMISRASSSAEVCPIHRF